MNEKIEFISKILIDQDKHITAAQLACLASCSTRSVKTYISEINQILPDSILSSSKGYIANKDNLIQILRSAKKNFPQTSKERVTYIITKLIKESTSHNIYDLSDSLFISTSTLKSDLVKVRKKTQEFDLSLFSKDDSIEINGIEKNKRKLLSSILYEETENHVINYSVLQEAFNEFDVAEIRIILLKNFELFNYYINDLALINLVLHIAITIDRIKQDSRTNTFLYECDESSHILYPLLESIKHDLEKKFSILLQKDELSDLLILLESRITNLDYRSIDLSKLKEIVGIDLFNTIDDLIQKINSYFLIDLSSPEFLVRFSLHIKNLITRSKNNYMSKNPLTQSIKTSCPLLFDAAVILSKEIMVKMNIAMNEDEIAYLAIHLGSAIDNQKILKEKITCVILCPNYYGLNFEIASKLENDFNDMLYISNIISDERYLNQPESYDLIISTVPLISIVSDNSIVISPLLTEKDLRLISKTIKSVQNLKLKRKFEAQLNEFLNPKLFNKNLGFTTMNQVLTYSCNQLQFYGYTKPDFINEVIERESLSSTSYGKIAIPHSMNNSASKTGMFIYLSDKPIQWEGSEVNIVLLLCVSKHQRSLFHSVFETLTMIFTEPTVVNTIQNCNTYEEFLHKIVHSIDII